MIRHAFQLLAAAALILAMPFAHAADLPAKAALPPVTPVPTWTGFYVGADVGGEWFNQSATWNPLPTPQAFGVLPIVVTDRSSGVIGGEYVGYNYQIGSFGLLGIEADFSVARNTGSVSQPWVTIPAGNVLARSFTAMSSRLDWIASVRERVGFLPLPQLLLYATGGVAWGKFNYEASSDNGFTAPGTSYNTAVSFGQTQSGWVAGGGAEWMLATHWLLRAEYLYYRFSSWPNAYANSVNFPNFPSAYIWGNPHVNVARVGVAYKF